MAPPATRAMRVVIVDDQPSFRGLVGNLLRALGGSWEMAGSAEEESEA